MTKYDDADWHPAKNGFAHIGLYLGWLIRRDLVDLGFFAEKALAEVKAGTMTGSDLGSDVDGTLTSDLLSRDGAAFSDWYYEKYLDDYAAAFPQVDAYSIVDDPGSRARIESLLDRRYTEWIAAGRPRNEIADLPEYEFTPKYGPNDPMPSIDEVMHDLQESLAKKGFASTPTLIRDMPNPHAAPDLEALLPAELRLKASSVTADQWGDSKLKRALKNLNVSGKAMHVASAIMGTGSSTSVVSIFGVPGVRRDQLEREFARVFRFPRMKETGVRTGPRHLHVSSGPGGVSAWWAVDGIVVFCSARGEDQLLSLVAKLP